MRVRIRVRVRVSVRVRVRVSVRVPSQEPPGCRMRLSGVEP